jgi:16S rRNA (guanine527-N7)-methyltransferase
MAPAAPFSERNDAYLALMAAWNQKINLTALRIDPPDDAAIERLIGEPTRAAELIDQSARVVLDLGSGGGSPAIPIKNARPSLSFVLVESKSRKCAFLREVARRLDLADVHIENCRFEELPTRRPDLARAADVVTFRAVRADESLWTVVNWALADRGQVLWFGGSAEAVPAWLVINGQSGAVLELRRQPTER